MLMLMLMLMHIPAGRSFDHSILSLEATKIVLVNGSRLLAPKSMKMRAGPLA